MASGVDELVGVPRGWADRAAVLVGSYALFFAARQWLTPWCQRTFFGFAEHLERGPKLLAGHLFVWQGPHTLVVALAMIALVQVGVFKGPARPVLGPALRWGLVSGVAISAVTAGIWFFAGPGFQVDIDFWKMGGNLVSNFYEELGYRGLLFGAGLYAFRRFLPASILSALAFGLGHTQYPLVFRLFTAGVGAIWALAYLRTKTLLSPWLSHQVSDMLLDTFLKT